MRFVPRWFTRNEKKDRSFDEIIRAMFSANLASNQNVTPQSALKCTTVHAIVRALTNAIGSYPIMAYQEQSDAQGKTTLEPLPNHPVMRILKFPNPRLTQTQYMRRIMTHVALWGNHISIKARGQSGPISFLRPVHPDIVSIDEDNPFRPIYRIRFRDGERRYTPNQIVHVTGGIAVDGLWAESPVTNAAEAIGLSLALENLVAELSSNGSLPAFLLAGGAWESKEQYDEWVNAFQAVYGPGGTGKGVAMLPQGMEAKELTFKPVDAQVLEMRKFQRTEIASVWGVPPHKLADLERATFANIEHQGLEFIQDVALPYARAFEQCFERDLLTDADRRSGVVIRFDLDGAERADIASRVSAYGKMFEVGAMNSNEIRAREGMSPREGGDEYVTALNMRISGDDDTDESEPVPGSDEPGNGSG